MVETPRFAYGGADGGGFLPNGITSLPSPAPSTASNQAAARLPQPRSKPLMRGSKKEDYARNYVSDRLMHISRRYVKKHGIPDPADEVTGYESMDEVCKDLEEVVDVLWFSGTPSLQIPYLLNVALAFNTYLPSFPPSPRPTFALLKKLDHCFASLLIGRDIKSGEPLPGLQNNGRGFTKTDMVRCKSLTDETRMLVATVMSDEPDVGNFVGNDDSEVARQPTRRNISVSISTGLIQSPGLDVGHDSDGDGDNIKSEDVLDFEEDSDSSNGGIPDHAGVKRKSEVTDEDDAEHEDNKRVKIEEENIGPKFSDTLPEHRSPDTVGDEPVTSQPKGQFHFILGDDDDDLDDDITPNTVGSPTIVPTAPTTAQATPATKLGTGEPEEEQDGEGDGEGDGEDEEDEEDEEEEELQLNVGKVYEKTLVQLGKSLGESITDG
ncbi:hypothetical protein K449DRAFT_460506 [Hypoxylon sp. EC38]|nr:hypothetical protein K449DRAFT_460506 [Hypoxylon sp. EC38]